MAGEARSALRSSARLQNGGDAGSSGRSSAAAESAAARAAAAARTREAAAAAAQRRARAAERAREVEDSPHVLREKCRLLARAVRNAKHLVVYTGAGISTAADIPDYRGPHGVWTRLQRGETVGRVEVSRAAPTLAHMALTALYARGTLKFVVSQNCDGLHLRAGLPRRALAELHGNMFLERCAACRRVYVRAFDTTERTARHAHGTARLCHRCGAELSDTIVHFGERGRAAWPLNWAGALRHAAAADVVLCLGSSLKVLRRYPPLWRMQHAPAARPALYIVNLQWTPKDAAAALKINARCDAVMAQVARRLRLAVPAYDPRADPLLAHAVPLAPPEQHTSSRPQLRLAPRPPAPPPPRVARPAPDSSPSASDSDEELPLRRLQERLRPPHPAPAPARLPPPLLHAFQVNLRSGDATILLRAEDAPSVGGGASTPPLPPVPPPRRAPLSELRLFRMRRPAPSPPPPPPPGLANGHAGPFAPALPRPSLCLPAPAAAGRALGEDEAEMKCETDADVKWDVNCKVKCEVKDEPRYEVKREVKEEAAESGASALAAAIIARAVLLCRAQLYPGLHTILGAGGGAGGAGEPAGGEAECAWCVRALGARRCRWYPPPPPGPRAWRRVRGRRYLCACCPHGRHRDSGGWYGKGYRKGRRRPRRR